MPPKNASGNTAPSENTAGNMPPKNASGNTPPSKNTAGSMPPENAARNAPPKKRKLWGDSEAGRKSEDDVLPDLDQAAKEYNPILGEEDENNSPTPTVSFYSYGRRYGRR
jgi:hypothetical protein